MIRYIKWIGIGSSGDTIHQVDRHRKIGLYYLDRHRDTG